MTTKEAIADINVIIKDLSVMSDTDMITDEGIKTLKALQHLIDIAKRFDGAVEVGRLGKIKTEPAVKPDESNPNEFYDTTVELIFTHESPINLHGLKLYAIPKEQCDD